MGQVSNSNEAIEFLKNQPSSEESYKPSDQEKKFWGKRLETFEEEIKGKPEELYNYIQKALALRNLARYKEAMKVLDALIEKDKKNKVAVNDKAICMLMNKNLKKAIPLFDRAIEIDPNYAIAYYNRAQTYSGLKKFEESLKDFQKCITLAGDEEKMNDKAKKTLANVYRKRGEVYVKVLDFKNGNSDFEKAVSLNKDLNKILLDRMIKLGDLIDDDDEEEEEVEKREEKKE